MKISEEKIIQDLLGKTFCLSGHLIVCPNVNNLMRGQQDFISVTRSKKLIEYEIKISRGDFKRDLKKTREIRWQFSGSMIRPNYFYYVVPCCVNIQVSDLPHWAGLYWVTSDGLEMIKKAPLLHDDKLDIEKVYKKVTTLFQQRQYLGGCLMTYKNRKNREAYEQRNINTN